MTGLFAAFGFKIVACLVFTLLCFLIAWRVGILYQYKDAKKMKEILLNQQRNRRNYFGKQVGKLALSILVLYGISFLVAYLFDSPLSSVSPFVGLLSLLLMLYMKFAPHETGEVTPYSGDMETTYIIVDPDEYFNTKGMTMIFGSFIFTLFEFGLVLL